MVRDEQNALGKRRLHRFRGRGLTNFVIFLAIAVPEIVLGSSLLALFVQWYSVTSESLRVTGTDAAHYHVPHAINFAHGASLFGLVATPHLYPMGTSIWAAWLLQPLQGPLLLDWTHRKWGVLPRLENGCLQASQPPDASRIDLWLRAAIQVPRRPDWYFVKLHAHGAPEDSHGTLLGEPMVRFHQELARRAQEDPHFHYHYVTAREMYNLVKAAEAGHRGGIAEALDFLLVSNLVVDLTV